MVVSRQHNGENQMNDYETYEVLVYKNGNKFWYQNGKRHRTDGPAAEYATGDKYWWQNGKRHRTDGPAVEYADGGKEWRQNGDLHRTDGPAVEGADGYKCWYIDGIYHTEKEFNEKMNSCEGKTVTIDGKEYRLTAI